jgi:hypothetical protein
VETSGDTRDTLLSFAARIVIVLGMLSIGNVAVASGPPATITSSRKLMLLVTNTRRKKPIHERRDCELTPKQRRRREKCLRYVSLRRRGLNRTAASKWAGVGFDTAQRNTNAFYKTHGRWRLRKVDHVPRQMVIYEDARKQIVEISDSRIANLISDYHNRIGQYMKTRNIDLLRLLRRKTFRDRKGKRHRLETRLLIVIALKAMERHPEFFHIYRG